MSGQCERLRGCWMSPLTQVGWGLGAAGVGIVWFLVFRSGLASWIGSRGGRQRPPSERQLVIGAVSFLTLGVVGLVAAVVGLVRLIV
jgi:hypothetical protein